MFARVRCAAGTYQIWPISIRRSFSDGVQVADDPDGSAAEGHREEPRIRGPGEAVEPAGHRGLVGERPVRHVGPDRLRLGRTVGGGVQRIGEGRRRRRQRHPASGERLGPRGGAAAPSTTGPTGRPGSTRSIPDMGGSLPGTDRGEERGAEPSPPPGGRHVRRARNRSAAASKGSSGSISDSTAPSKPSNPPSWGASSRSRRASASASTNPVSQASHSVSSSG